MRRYSYYLNRLLFFTLASILFLACNKTNEEELLADHDRAMDNFKQEYNITEADLIEDGIYVHFTSEIEPEDTIFASANDWIVVDLLGIDSENNVFDITSESSAESYGIDRNDYVYGPLRIKVDDTFRGFFKAIQKVPEGAEATLLFPHDQAFGNYEPILYKVKNHRVITDIDTYIDNEFNRYREELGMTLEDTLLGEAPIYFLPLVTTTNTPDPAIYYGDVVKICLHAYYVETDDAYVEGFPGREYFPINNSGDTILFEFGFSNFPITEAIHIVIPQMKLGEKWEVLSPSQYAYGEDGFKHPVMGNIIVPVYMPVHYTIELLGYQSSF